MCCRLCASPGDSRVCKKRIKNTGSAVLSVTMLQCSGSTVSYSALAAGCLYFALSHAHVLCIFNLPELPEKERPLERGLAFACCRLEIFGSWGLGCVPTTFFFSVFALLLFITLIPSRQTIDLSPSCFHSLPLLCPILRASSSSSSKLGDATTGAVLATKKHRSCLLSRQKIGGLP